MNQENQNGPTDIGVLEAELQDLNETITSFTLRIKRAENRRFEHVWKPLKWQRLRLEGRAATLRDAIQSATALEVATQEDFRRRPVPKWARYGIGV